MTEGTLRKTTSWDVPCCPACEPHFSKFYPKWAGAAPKERDPAKLVRTPLQKVGWAVWVVAAVGIVGVFTAHLLRRELGGSGSIAAGGAAALCSAPVLAGWIWFVTGWNLARKRAELQRYNDIERENAAGQTRHITTAKANCSHTDAGAFVYARSQAGDAHTFIFARRDLALAFKAANAGAVVSSDV